MTQMKEKIGKGTLTRRTLRLLTANFSRHNVSRNAAALTYYLLYAMFPLLIFVCNLVGRLNLDVTAITDALRNILPTNVVEMLGAYLKHVSNNSSQVLMWFSLVFTVYFPFRAVKDLMDDVRQAYQLDKPRHPVRYAVRQVLFTLAFLVMIMLTLLLSILGQRFLSAVGKWLSGFGLPPTPSFVLALWQYVRFVLAAAVMFAALGMLYGTAQDERQPLSATLPGVVVAMVAWLAVSIGFSFYVENFSYFSVIYGTLGAVIVLLSWLYFTSLILILGAEFNAALRTARDAE